MIVVKTILIDLVIQTGYRIHRHALDLEETSMQLVSLFILWLRCPGIGHIILWYLDLLYMKFDNDNTLDDTNLKIIDVLSKDSSVPFVEIAWSPNLPLFERYSLTLCPLRVFFYVKDYLAIVMKAAYQWLCQIIVKRLYQKCSCFFFLRPWYNSFPILTLTRPLK